jgi:hypothetical protein
MATIFEYKYLTSCINNWSSQMEKYIENPASLRRSYCDLVFVCEASLPLRIYSHWIELGLFTDGVMGGGGWSMLKKCRQIWKMSERPSLMAIPPGGDGISDGSESSRIGGPEFGKPLSQISRCIFLQCSCQTECLRMVANAVARCLPGLKFKNRAKWGNIRPCAPVLCCEVTMLEGVSCS